MRRCPIAARALATLAMLALTRPSRAATPVPNADSLDAAIRVRWAQAECFEIDWTARAHGAVPCDIAGHHRIEPRAHRVAIEYAGTFAGTPVRSTLRANADSMWTGAKAQAVPADLTHAILYGIARMGVLHNIANLVQGAPPEHAAGGIEQWLVGEAIRCDGVEYVGGVRCWVLQMDLRIEGTRVADTRGWYDADTLMPVRREVNVNAGGIRFTDIEVYRTPGCAVAGTGCTGGRR